LGWWKNSWWGIGWFGTHSWNRERKDLGYIVKFCIICVMWEWDKIVFAGFCCLSNLFWVFFLCVCMDDLFIYLFMLCENETIMRQFMIEWGSVCRLLLFVVLLKCFCLKQLVGFLTQVKNSFHNRNIRNCSIKKRSRFKLGI